MSRSTPAPAPLEAPKAAPKRGRGRPRLDTTGAAMRHVGIKVPAAEASALEAIAAARQTSVSELLRAAITEIVAGAARTRR